MIETSNTNEHTNNNINIPVDPVDDDTASGPFEGPEKLLELWFEPAAPVVDVSETGDDLKKSGRVGLRTVDRVVWEEMLDIVKCKVLSVVYGEEMDAYLLRCVLFPHRQNPSCGFSCIIRRIDLWHELLVSIVDKSYSLLISSRQRIIILRLPS